MTDLVRSQPFRHELSKRIGVPVADRIMAMWAEENRADDYGLREQDEPSRAIFEMERALLSSPLTGDELRRIRIAAEINPVADIARMVAAPVETQEKGDQ